jgi:glycosyltransferase involved in cell wall biosynthesis
MLKSDCYSLRTSLYSKTMSQPLITIGISTYNRAKSLDQYCLVAISQLNYSNYEVIVVDDCSTDQTQSILAEYQSKLPLRILRNPKNRGLCYSRNRILAEAQGEIIIFTDDDVSLFPDCLDEILKVYSQTEAAFAWGCVYQCHSSEDWTQPTFGTGSLFSIRRCIADYFKFDTNIRYFKTYGCEEHDFARRVQTKLGVISAVEAKANHYQAPAKDRAWRGLGGDLNYLYERLKRGSLLGYYSCLLLGFVYTTYHLTVANGSKPSKNQLFQRDYQEAVHALRRFLVLIKERRFAIAGQYLFYVWFDIPVRAWFQRRIERQQLQQVSALAITSISCERDVEAVFALCK